MDDAAIIDRCRNQVARLRAAGASGARIAWTSTKGIRVELKAGRLKEASARHSSSFTVEVINHGHRSQAQGTELESLPQVARDALDLTAVGAAAHVAEYPTAEPVPEVPLCDPAVADMSGERLVDLAATVNQGLVALEPDLHVECEASRTCERKILVTSGGVALHGRTSNWRLDGFIWRTRGTDMLLCFGERYGCRQDGDLDPTALVSAVGDDLATSREPVGLLGGRMAAILHPEVVARLFWAFFAGINGRNVARGQSPLAGRLGERIFASSLTLIDDPHRPYARGSCSWDEVGQASRVQTLAEAGVLARFLYDHDTAGLARTASTANNGCAPYRPRLCPGTVPSRDLIAGLGDGIYVKGLMGFGQGNLVNGDVAANVALGWRIEHGRLAGRVKDVMITGNIYELLKEGVAVSSDTDFTGCWPWLKVQGLAVSTQLR